MLNRLMPSFEAGITKEQGPAQIEFKELNDMIQKRNIAIQPEEKELFLQKYTISYKGEKMYLKAGYDEEYYVHPSTEKMILQTFGVDKVFKEYTPTKFEGALNEALQTHKWFGKERVARLATVGGERCIRAIVSTTYGYMDDVEWIARLGDKIDLSEWRADLVQIVDEFTHVRFTHKNVTALKKVGETMKRALDFKNSEVGQGSIKVQFLNYILQCTNGATSPSIVDFNKTSHRGGSRFENFDNDFSSVLSTASTKGWKNIEESFERASDIIIPEPDRVFEKSIREFQLRKHMLEPIQKQFEIKPGSNSLYDVSMAYSKAAQSYDKDERLMLERAGGKILDYNSLKHLVKNVDISSLRNLN